MIILVGFFMCIGQVYSDKSVSYISFSKISNPTNSSVKLEVLDNSISSVYQVYTVEFWLRPLYETRDWTKNIVMSNENDWNIIYYTINNTILIESNTGTYYCTVCNVLVNQWTHMCLTYDYINTVFSCYINGILDMSNTVEAVPMYPNYLLIGNNFYGNMYELRTWIGEARSPDEVYQYYNSLYAQPYPSKLTHIWRLTQEVKNNTITDAIKLSVSYIPTAIKTPWVTETPPSNFMCYTGSYNINQTCYNCSGNCKFCKNNVCYETARYYLDFYRIGYDTDVILINNVNTNDVACIEFWVFPEAWTGSDAEILRINNFFLAAQRGSGKFVSFYDGSNIERLYVPAYEGYWMHISWVYYSANTSAVFYINNATYASVTWTNTSASYIYLGGISLDVRFNGIVSDLRFWKTARNSTQILSNLANSFYNSSTDLYRYFPLNDTGSSIQSADLESSITKQIIGSLWRSQNCSSENCLFECPFGYYSMPSGDCLACDSSCQACSGPSPDDCTVCLPSDLKIAGRSDCYKKCPNSYASLDGTCLASCPEGHYNNTGVCTACPFPCINCINATYCSSCSSGYLLYTNITNNCVKICNGSKYRDANNACQACDNTCLECSGPSAHNCLVCNSSLYIYNGTCISKCPANTFALGSACYDCDKSCYNCTGASSLQCIACNTGYNYKDSYGNCYEACPGYLMSNSTLCVEDCPTHTYKNTNVCQPCDSSCLECGGPSAWDCIACAKYYYNKKCYTECPGNTYSNGSNCYDCDSSCSSCSLASNNCTSCSSNYPYSYQGKCYDQCPVYTFLPYKCVDKCVLGFMPVANVCTPCDSSCLSCSGALEACSSCTPGMHLFNSTCVYQCPSGFYNHNEICLACNSSCKACADQNFCTECNDSSLYLDADKGLCVNECGPGTYTYDFKCVDHCPDNWYSDYNNACQMCSAGCKDCLNSSTCTGCYSGYYLYAGQCVGACPDRYYPAIGASVCSLCYSGCLECSGGGMDDCTVCDNGLLLYTDANGSKDCVDACPKGAYKANLACILCNSTCNECTSGLVCSDCKQGYFLKNSGACEEKCEYGDIELNRVCAGYTSIYPTGPIDLEAFVMLNITYPIPVTPGTGNISIYYYNSTSYSLLTSFTSAAYSYSIGNSLYTPIDPVYLSYDRNYTIMYKESSVMSSSSYNNIIPIGIWNVFVNPIELQPLQVIINKNIKNLELQLYQNFLLDSSYSYDPSELYTSKPLYGYWNCSDFSNSFKIFSKKLYNNWESYANTFNSSDPYQTNCINWNYQSLPENKLMNITSMMNSINLVLRFTYTLTDYTRYSTNDILIRVVSPNSPTVYLVSTPVYRVDVNKPLQLVAGGSSEFLTGYQWSCNRLGVNYLTPLAGSLVLKISEKSLAEEFYIFSVTYTDIVYTVSTSVIVHTNTPPYGGTTISDKFTGLSVLDTFSIKTSGWVDLDLPLLYSHYLTINDSNIQYQLYGVQSAPSVQVILPEGSIKVISYCYDALGSRDSSQVDINVTSLHDFIDITIQIERFVDTLDINSTMYVLSCIFTFASELNYPFANTQPVLFYKYKLLEILNQITVIMQGHSGPQYVYTAIGVLGCVQKLLDYNQSEDLVVSCIDVLGMIDFGCFSTLQNLFFRDSNINAISTQYLLTTDEIINISNILSKILMLFSQFPGIFVDQVDIFIENIQSVSSIGLSLLEVQRNVTGGSIYLITRKSLLYDVQGTCIDIKFSKVCIGEFNDSNNTEVSITAGHMDKNPFNGTSAVLPQVIFLKIQTADNQIPIPTSNLTQPFIFSFNATSHELNSIKLSLSQTNPINYWPKCIYWDFDSLNWKEDGCKLYNIKDIYTYFYTQIPDHVIISCACTHLSYFSVGFGYNTVINNPVYIINKAGSNDFDFYSWNHGIVIYILMLSFAGFIVMVLYGWHKDRKGSDVDLWASSSFGYWDTEKVECIIKQLDQKSMDPSLHTGTGRSIMELASSPLYSALKNSTNETSLQSTFDETPSSIKTLKKKKLDYKLEKYLSSPSTPLSKLGGLRTTSSQPEVTEPKSYESNSQIHISSNKDKINEKTIQTSDIHSMKNYDPDNFSKKFDTVLKTQKISQRIAFDKVSLKLRHLQYLGISHEEFFGLRVQPDQTIVPNSDLITGSNYCNI